MANKELGPLALTEALYNMKQLALLGPFESDTMESTTLRELYAKQAAAILVDNVFRVEDISDQQFVWPDYPITNYNMHNPMQAEMFNHMRPFYRHHQGSNADWIPREAFLVCSKTYTGTVLDIDKNHASIVMGHKNPLIRALPLFGVRVWARPFTSVGEPLLIMSSD